MFNIIKDKEEFDDEIIGDLKNLAEQDQLINSDKIIENISNKGIFNEIA